MSYAGIPTPLPRRRYLVSMRRNTVRLATGRRRALPALYGALFEIAAMKASVAELRGDLAAAEADRLLGKLDKVEIVALSLLEAMETQRPVAMH